MRPRHPYFVAAIVALAAACAVQLASQIQAGVAATAAARGIDSQAARVAGLLGSAGMTLACVGIAFWIASAIKRQTSSHAALLALVGVYAILVLMMV